MFASSDRSAVFDFLGRLGLVISDEVDGRPAGSDGDGAMPCVASARHWSRELSSSP